jgi:polysaccharide pyruvyl transferase WcaK-like protein
LAKSKVHVIHVGNMNNKGTQALFKSDVQIINSTAGDVSISVSTTDAAGVRRLGLPSQTILPPFVDIPYETADILAKRLAIERHDFAYKILTFAALILMLLQIPLALFSIIEVQLGLKPIYRGGVIEHIKNCDVVVSHSDESFKETASLLPLNLAWLITWWSMLLSRTCEVLAAKSFRKPMILFPNSVGPFRTAIGRSLGHLSLDGFDILLIRDPVSYEIVRRMKVRSPEKLTYDTALLFSTKTQGNRTNFKRPVIGVSPGVYSNSISSKEVNDYILAHARALDKSIGTYGFSIVFLPHYISGFSLDDLEICKLIRGKMTNQKMTQIIETKSVDDFKNLLDQMDMVISSKMHPAVLAASGYVPTICVAYDHKQTSFFERLKMADCLIEIHSLSHNNLYDKIESVWKNRERISELLRKSIPRCQENLRATIRDALACFIETQ